jgi:hypothetical protein
MPWNSLRYRFRQPFDVPAREAFEWCTDFRASDGELFSGRTLRTVTPLTEDTLVLEDTTYPGGRPRRIRRLVRIDPTERAWTNTHLDGPFRHSQYWYRIVADGASRSYLDFRGLRLVRSPRRLAPEERERRAEAERRNDSTEWRTHLAPALEADCRSAARRPRGRQTRPKSPTR